MFIGPDPMQISSEVSLQTDRAAAKVGRSVIKVARKHFIITCVYLLGIALALVGAGLNVDPHLAHSFERKMEETIHSSSKEMLRLVGRLREAEDLYYRHKGWFTCDEICTRYYHTVSSLKEEIGHLKMKQDARMLETRMSVGAWSSYAIADLRKSFWESWERGKEAAKRLTMFDAVFMGMNAIGGSSVGSRDDSFLYTMFQILLQFLLNLSFGLTTSLIVFIFEAWGIIYSYGPSLISGLCLFLLVVVASSSFVLTAIAGVFGGLCGGIYYLARSAEKRARLDGSNRQRRIHVD
jgi:hypothetical protein